MDWVREHHGSGSRIQGVKKNWIQDPQHCTKLLNFEMKIRLDIRYPALPDIRPDIQYPVGRISGQIII
jgi:hypothetical protein